MGVNEVATVKIEYSSTMYLLDTNSAVAPVHLPVQKCSSSGPTVIEHSYTKRTE